MYIADGSHAAYPARCEELIACSQPNVVAGVVHVPETEIDGRRPWARNSRQMQP